MLTANLLKLLRTPPPRHRLIVAFRPNMKATRWRFGDPFRAPRRSSYALTEAAEALKSIQQFHVALATTRHCWRRRAGASPLLPGLSWGGGGGSANVEQDGCQLLHCVLINLHQG